MAKKHESKRNIEDLTNPETYDAIRYLEQTSARGTEGNHDFGLVICISLLILLLGCLGFMFTHWRLVAFLARV